MEWAIHDIDDWDRYGPFMVLVPTLVSELQEMVEIETGGAGEHIVCMTIHGAVYSWRHDHGTATGPASRPRQCPERASRVRPC